jgi:hypothetical protein
VCEEVLVRASFVRFQSIIENHVKVVGLVGGRCGYVSVGHDGENEEFVHAERRQDSGFVGTEQGGTSPREFENICHPERHNC